MTPLREMDVAVARAMDRNVWRWRDLPPYSTDDLTALAQCVPWLLGKGLRVDVEFIPIDDVRLSVLTLDDEIVMEVETDGPNALAAALCQVVLAVAAQEPRG